MKKWAAFLKRDREEEQEIINLAIAAANNHHAGLGPATANTFRKMLDLSEVTWNDDFRVSETEGEALPGNPRQTSQPDFLKLII
jgi:hypothetical protein